MMRVVSDTSPVCNLAIIGRLDFLRRLHGTVLTPPAVRQELSHLQHEEGRAAVEAAFYDGWLKLEHPNSMIPPIAGLHAGEREAIALALEEKETLLLMDEAEGRAVARAHGITITGVVGILITARRNGWIQALNPELLALRTEARFFLAPRILAEALAAVGEC